LGCYGYNRGTTPNLDALAKEGVLFEQCFSHVPITLPSHTCILSSRVPCSHGVRDNGIFTVPDGVLTLPEVLSEADYETGAVVAAFVLDSRYNLDQGFDTYNDNLTEDWSEEEIQERIRNRGMILERKADLVYQAASEWLDSASSPFFLWVHFYDPHQPLNPPEPWFESYFDDLYDGEIAFMDEYVGMLLDRIEAKGVKDNTLVVVTADHGEGLGDHGEPTHAMLLFDATLHVPLIIRLPGEAARTARIPDMVRSIDIAPTILDVLGEEIPADFEGVSLYPRMLGRGGKLHLDCYHENMLPYHSFGWSTLRAWRKDGWKWIEAPHELLFRYSEDPAEIHNRIRAKPGLADEFAGNLDVFVDSIEPAASEGPDTIDPETVEALKGLGYLGAGGGGGRDYRYARGPDPNEMIAVHGLISAARQALVQQNHAAATLYLSEIEDQDPENAQLYALRAMLHMQRGDLEQAAADLDRAIELSPVPTKNLFDRGLVSMDLRRYEEAEGFFQRVLDENPKDVSALYQSAVCRAKLGDNDGALAVYRLVLSIDPSHLDSRINAGVELARLRRFEEAEKTLQEARALAPYSSRLLYNLGMVRADQGEWSGARDAFDLALRSRPDYVAAMLGLAVALRNLGEDEAAAGHLQRIIELAPDTSTAEKAKDLLQRWGG